MDTVTIRMSADKTVPAENPTLMWTKIKILFAITTCVTLYVLSVFLIIRYQAGVRVPLESHRAKSLGFSFLDEDPIPEFVLYDDPKDSSAETTTAEPSDSQLLNIEDLFISVKTTKKFHQSRLDVISKTWFKLARDQTFFFTDEDDEQFSRQTYNHLINTRCPSSHNRKALCCKMGAEFDHYIQSRKKWWCHFDDDNYVNVPQLLPSLQKFDHREDWYLGKTSIKDPLETRTRGKNPENVSFRFGTGGAGFCISQSLALRMKPVASKGRFSDVGESIRLPDDVTMGYVVEVLLNKKLTVLPNFHSHLESLGYIEQETFKDQISFSYSSNGNILSLDETFDHSDDPTRFISLHCYLFPQFDICRQMRIRTALRSKYHRLQASGSTAN